MGLWDNAAMRGRPFPAFAAGACLLAAVVTLFPVLVAGRVVSPLDTVANEPPWRGVRPPVQVANPELGEAATAVLARALLARRTGLATAVWNPYVACGSPGWLAWGSGVLSPFVLPWLWVVDEARLLDLVVLGKLLAAFWFTFALLARRGAGERAAAIGALAYALAAPVAGRWLWPESAGAALLPALLLAVDRACEPPWPRHVAVVAAVAALLAAGGTPGIAVLAAYLAAAWALRRGLEDGRPGRAVAVAAGGLALAALLVAPCVLLRLTWPLPGTAPERTAAWGPGALRLLVNPWAWGDPRAGTFVPPAPLAGLGWHAVALTVGTTTVALAVVGLAARGRDRWWWAAVATLSLGVVTVGPVAAAVRHLPGTASIVTGAFAVPAALALAALAAGGWETLARAVPPRVAAAGAAAVAAAIVLGQGLVAGHVLTFLRPEEARLQRTPGLAWLAEHVRPGERIAPLFTTLPPDLAGVLGLEDLRSAWGAPAAYRRLLHRIDPQSWGPYGRALLLNGATIRLTHPELAALGARWVLEPPDLHLVEFALDDEVEQLEPRTGRLGPLAAGQVVEQELDLPPGVSRLVLPVMAGSGATAELRVALIPARGGPGEPATLRVTPGRAVWLDLPADTPPGPAVLRLEVVRIEGPLSFALVGAPRPPAGPMRVNGRTARGALALGLDRSGYALAYEGPDLRIWENRRALGPAWAVDRARTGSSLPEDGPPLTELPVVTGGPRGGIVAGPAEVTARAAAPGRVRARVRSARGTLLVTSLAGPRPVWRATVDGRTVPTVALAGGLVGVEVPAGEHVVKIAPRLPPGWWMPAALGLLAAAVAWRAGGRTAR